MWNRRKDDEYAPRPAAQPAPAEPVREAPATMSSNPAPRYEPTPVSSGSASIGKAVMVKGQIISREDLYVDGDIEGTLEAHEHRITVGPNGKVKSAMKAREIIILGTVQGNQEATDKIEIRKEGRLVGDIKTARIVIEDGAFFKGSIDITREAVKPNGGAKQPQPAQAQPPAPAPAAAPAQPAAPQQQTLQPSTAAAEVKR